MPVEKFAAPSAVEDIFPHRDRLREIIGASRKISIIGVGNPTRGDDGAGIAVIAGIMESFGAPADSSVFSVVTSRGVSLLLIDSRTTPENYISEILEHSPECVLFIDCADFSGSGLEPGSVRIFDERPVVDKPFLSSHCVPLTLVAAIIRKKIPAVSLGIIGIQPSCVDFDAPADARVLKSCSKLTEDFRELLN